MKHSVFSVIREKYVIANHYSSFSNRFADENFAREIMQLFSIGLVVLNMDGTPVLDENGNAIPTYTNDHIMSYARAWTGFDIQGSRANSDRSFHFWNRLDPMKINAEWYVMCLFNFSLIPFQYRC